MRELALVGAGRVGSAFLKIWNNREIIVIDPRVPMDSFLGYALVDEIHAGMAKVAIVAVPGDIASIKIIECFEAGMNVVDVSFHNYDCKKLGEIAKKHGCWYLPDAGFGPGIMNMMCSRLAQAYNPISINAYIGGNPLHRKAPWFYKSTWNSADHLEEYTRPARYIENGAVKTVMPLESDTRIIDVPGVGSMEAFCSDGLRTLLDNPGTANMAEFTLRWPGFIDNMKLMWQSGMLLPGTIDHFATGIALSKQWTPEKDEQDLSVLFVEARVASDERVRGMRMIHTRDGGEHSSMSWCTAAGTAAALNMALDAQESLNMAPGLHTIETMVHDSSLFAAYYDIFEQVGIKIVEYYA